MLLVKYIGQERFFREDDLLIFARLIEALDHAPLPSCRQVPRQFGVHPLHGLGNLVCRNAFRHDLHNPGDRTFLIIRLDEFQALHANRDLWRQLFSWAHAIELRGDGIPRHDVARLIDKLVSREIDQRNAPPELRISGLRRQRREAILVDVADDAVASQDRKLDDLT